MLGVSSATVHDTRSFFQLHVLLFTCSTHVDVDDKDTLIRIAWHDSGLAATL